jgi:SWI/SNF-related matrix-associated actin-dependent regulator 1 of chromatin subfamily A
VKLYPYQVEGVEFLKANPRALLADEMGLGKTLQALTAIKEFGTKSILIICPKHLRGHWRTEARRVLNRYVAIWPNLGYVIIAHFEALKQLENAEFEACIIDEAHYIKNSDTLRSGQVKRLMRKCSRIIALTGSPILNTPEELETILDTFDIPPQAILRRTKAEVLPNLPPKIRQTRMVTAERLESLLREEMKWALQSGFDLADPESWLRRKVDFYEFAASRRRLAMAKAPLIVERAEEILRENPDDKLVIFCHHQNVSAFIAQMLPNSVLVTGETDFDTRMQSIKAFQEKKWIRTFIGSFYCASVGISLTAASYLLFAELDLVPALLCQAEDRLCRIGQAKTVVVEYLVVEGSLDSHMVAILEKKQQLIDGILGA